MLNQRYQELLKLSAVEQGGAPDPERTLALEHILAQIERRGQQLFLLRKSQSEVEDASERSVLHSPEAARKKAASLKLLQQFKNLNSAQLQRLTNVRCSTC